MIPRDAVRRMNEELEALDEERRQRWADYMASHPDEHLPRLAERIGFRMGAAVGAAIRLLHRP